MARRKVAQASGGRTLPGASETHALL